MSFLKQRIINKINELGYKEARKFFGVSLPTIYSWVNGKTAPSLAALELVLAQDDPLVAGKPTSARELVDIEEKLFTWEGKDVIILQPVYRSVNPDTHFTLFANYARYGVEKLGLIYEKRTLIHESRNVLATKFLKTTAKTCIMVDDDMILPCGSVDLFNNRWGAGVSEKSAGYNAISRIMSHPADRLIVGALYFGRNPAGKPQCAMGFTSAGETAKLRNGEYTGLVEDGWVGTGFIRIGREVFERMKVEIDKGKWPECHPQGNSERYGFFTPQAVSIGEDVSFGRRAKEIGIKSYLDGGLVCLHVGECPYGPKNTKGSP